MGAVDAASLLAHPRSGATWEGFALEQVIRLPEPDEVHFWATHAGAELDLLMTKNGRRVGVEFKRTDAPKLTPSMRIALDDLGLEVLFVVYPGTHRFSLEDRVEAVPLSAFVARRGRRLSHAARSGHSTVAARCCREARRRAIPANVTRPADNSTTDPGSGTSTGLVNSGTATGSATIE